MLLLYLGTSTEQLVVVGDGGMARNRTSSNESQLEDKELYDFEVGIDRAGEHSDIHIRTGEDFVEIRTGQISLSVAIDDYGKMMAYVFDTDNQKVLYHKPI